MNAKAFQYRQVFNNTTRRVAALRPLSPDLTKIWIQMNSDLTCNHMLTGREIAPIIKAPMFVAVMDMQNWQRFHYENLSLNTIVVFQHGLL